MSENEKYYFVNGGKFTKLQMVTKGIEQCLMDDDKEEYFTQCYDCPYYSPGITVKQCKEELQKDTIEFLKEKKAVAIEWKYGFPHCPVCGQMLPEGDAVKYCLHCGRKVKWE